MGSTNLNLITISYAKRALLEGSRERGRMLEYGKHLKSFHVVVFTGSGEDYPTCTNEGNVHFYATKSKSKLSKIIDAYKITKKIIQSLTGEEVVVTSQDPFEAGLVGKLATYGTSARHHVQIHADIFSPAWRDESFQNSWRAKLAKMILANSESVRVVSERIKRSLLKMGIDDKKITVLPIKASLDDFIEVGDSRKYQTNDRVRFIYVGRFSVEKNVPILIEAAEILQNKGFDFELLLMGDGVMKSKLEEMVKDKGLWEHVTFLAWSENVPAAMAKADALVLASAHEGWGMVLVEAMAAGLPIVTTDVGCVGELLRDTEEALVVKNASSQNFATAMETLIKDVSLREKIGKTGLSTAKKFASTTENYFSDWRSTYDLPN